jgi:CHAT domain-containing protein
MLSDRPVAGNPQFPRSHLWKWHLCPRLWKGLFRRIVRHQSPVPALDGAGATGVSGGRRGHRLYSKLEWVTSPSRRPNRIAISALLTFSGIFCGCQNHASHPEITYSNIGDLFIHGNLAKAHEKARKATEQFALKNVEWSWKFRLVDASILLSEGRNHEVLALLSEEPLQSLAKSDIALQRLQLQIFAYAALGQRDQADEAFRRAKLLSADMSFSSANDPLLRARSLFDWGAIYLQRGDLGSAEEMFHKVLDLVRQQNSPYMQASTLLNLGVIALQQEHFDQALSWSDEAAQIAKNIHAQSLQEKARGNIAWASYKLGNYEAALDGFRMAEQDARSLGEAYDMMLWLENIGLSLYQLGNPQGAGPYYEEALHIAENTQNAEIQISAHIALAELDLKSQLPGLALQHTKKALDIAHSSGRAADEMDALFLKSLIAAHQKDTSQAIQILSNLDHDPAIRPSLQWQVESALANIYAETGNLQLADKWYRQSITTFEDQRATIRREESKLPFSTNAEKLYDDYIRFLVSQKKTDVALQWLDLGRARTLEEGLGIASPDFRSAIRKPLDTRAIARRLHGTILVYSLAPQESYLWAINSAGTHLFRLPAQDEIDAHIRKYQQAILNSRDTLADSYADGIALYNILIKPAQKLIPKDSPVFIVPDGSLATLNFETLLAPGGGVHYWIEDAVITEASSLKLLAAFRPEAYTQTAKKLLIMGDPISPDEKFPALLNAGTEIGSIASHFPPASETVLTQKQAVPSAYTRSGPAQFAYIHFVAHGTSSSAQPLDSAIVLTREPSDPDSFKLYARNIIQQPLHADLVTISACYGSGSRIYGGEGLVGLSWAFLRAGAHYVVGSLWEASDAAAPQLMDRMYDGLAKGRPPDIALREAKLSLLHSQGVFRKPLYWATFQLYGGA